MATASSRRPIRERARRFLRNVVREGAAGVTVGCVTTSTVLAAGSLAYAPIGPVGVALGAQAGLVGAIAGGLIAAMVARSSFVVSAPRASLAVVIASIVAGFATAAGGDIQLVLLATAVTIACAGALQAILAWLGAARIVQFTPFPVLSGYVNGIALLLLMIQISWIRDAIAAGADLWLPVFVAIIATLAIALRRFLPKVPAHFLALVAGIAAYHTLARLLPTIRIGETFKTLPDGSAVTLLDLGAGMSAGLVALAPQIALGAGVLAVVATLEALVGLRVAQTLSEMPRAKPRDLLAQGSANIGAAMAGGLPVTVTTTQTSANFHSGGQSRISVVISVAVVAVILVAGAPILDLLPQSVLVALLTATALQTFDLRGLQAIRDGWSAAGGSWRTPVHTAVVLAVMALVASGRLAAGAVLGTLLSGAIFIAEMSRSVIRRVLTADRIMSKRKRPLAQVEALRREGQRGVVVELRGILFFGNADELMNHVRRLSKRCDTLVLDFRDIRHIDISGAAVLGTMVQRCKRRRVAVALSGVRPTLLPIVARACRDVPLTQFPDLDSALEWLETRTLTRLGLAAPAGTSIALRDVEVFRGLAASDIAILEAMLERQQYGSGEVLCREGDAADTMWVLTRGSVSVRIARGGSAVELRRVASLTVGTTVGEMALLEGGRRSATIVADEDVECCAISETTLNELVESHPTIAVRLLINLGNELSKRLRLMTDALRDARG